MRHWFFLFVAIAAEVTGTSLMKWGSDSGHPGGLVAMFALLAISYYLLSLAVERVPMGVAYAVWEGVGIVMISVVSLVVFDEVITPGKAVGIAAVLLGILMLKRGIASTRSVPAEAGADIAPTSNAARNSQDTRVAHAAPVARRPRAALASRLARNERNTQLARVEYVARTAQARRTGRSVPAVVVAA